MKKKVGRLEVYGSNSKTPTGSLLWPFPKSQVEHENHDFVNSRTTVGNKLEIVAICSQYIAYSLFNVQETFFSSFQRSCIK